MQKREVSGGPRGPRGPTGNVDPSRLSRPSDSSSAHQTLQTNFQTNKFPEIPLFRQQDRLPLFAAEVQLVACSAIPGPRDGAVRLKKQQTFILKALFMFFSAIAAISIEKSGDIYIWEEMKH